MMSSMYKFLLLRLLALTRQLESTRATPQPSLSSKTNFPDPSIIHDPISGNFYAYATVSGKINTQIATSKTAKGPWTLTGKDALPTPGSWTYTSDPQIWAPDVHYLPDRQNNSYVMYYSGRSNNVTSHHCVGVAYADSPTGPFVDDSADAWACPLDQGGAIDAAGFYDKVEDKRYVVYKVDGSSLCPGGACGNEPANCPTPILLQEVSVADGKTKIGAAVQIMDRDDTDGPLIEAPNLVRIGGLYVMFFSSHCFNSPDYDIKYAVSDNITGPYVRPVAELLGPSTTDRWNLSAPGGATSLPDGGFMLFHANCAGGRCLYQTEFSFENGTVRIG
jgi:beta-xylosidase